MPPITESVTDDYLKSLGQYYDEVAEFESKRTDQTWLEAPELKQQFTENEVESFEQIPYQPTKEDLGYAIFAKESYQPINKRTDFDDYKYLQSDSSDSIATYLNENKNELVFALKGTSGEQPISEFFRNTGIALGTVGSAFTFPKHNENTNFINEVKSKYPNKKITVTGHSAGGSFANYQGVDNPDYNVVTYNMGTGLPLMKNWLVCKLGNCENIRNYKIIGDWASSFSTFSQGNTFLLKPRIPTREIEEQAEQIERFYLPSEVSLAHGINQFIDRNDNLKEDYGRYGRKIAGSIGGLVGLATPLAIQKARPFLESRVAQEAGRIAVEAVQQRLTSPSTPPRTRVEEIVSSPIQNTFVAMHGLSKKASTLNDVTQSMLGVGLGKLAGEISYDLFFKPSEEDILKF